MKLKGGSDLRARLASIPAGGPEMVEEWAAVAADRMRATAPNAKRAESRKFSVKARGLRSAVYGAYWWIFVDRGTKAHTIFGSDAKNPPDTLKFNWRGRTIFSKKVRHPRTGRRPFISQAAQDALASSRFADVIIRQWNSRKLRGRTRFI